MQPLYREYMDVQGDFLNYDDFNKNFRIRKVDSFNFAYDIVDRYGREDPDRPALLWTDPEGDVVKYDFRRMMLDSNKAANYLTSLGLKKGDAVLLILKRHHEFWPILMALHKIGAIAIPATNQLLEHDFTYRFEKAGVSAIVCTGDGDTAHQVELAEEVSGMQLLKIIVGLPRDGWHDFDEEYALFSRRFRRRENSPCGNDPMLMFFSSGTTGYPKIVQHSYKYALGHFVTAPSPRPAGARPCGASSTVSGSARARCSSTTSTASTQRRSSRCSRSTTSPPSARLPPCTACSSSRISPAST